MKKSLFLVVTGAFIGSAVSFAATTIFFDIPMDAWYRGSVERLTNRGIVNGYSDGSFQGDKNVSRAEVATMIDRAVEYFENTKTASLNLEDAQRVVQAANACTKEGVISDKGSYNKSSKTWLFEINTSSHPGCKSFCLINDTTRIATIDWRCVQSTPP